MNPLFFIGSLPYGTVEEAISFVKKFSPHLPFLPQLPEANSQEDMVGQVLRGFELGHWDEKASKALERFQNEFCEAERFKVQIAGPFTVSRALSLPFAQIVGQWLDLVKGLQQQLRQGAFTGDLWLQVDEPTWSLQNPFPPDYLRAMRELAGTSRKLQLGIHSCATQRPLIGAQELEAFSFFSFDYSRSPLTEVEKRVCEQVLENPRQHWVWGGITPAGMEADPWVMERPGIWLSAPCGLYGWKPMEIERTFTPLLKG